eukprot:CAMPEP_0172657436 /NCGR_PEP_ID=MMETSP1074-20121228/2085_1 /TAXON_ID=2916 /ORGANISM="Ceratium fusus, Strain PA161109" /LENGTH=215 /DNA_ID=CAMNT_0013472513 /DNA_START=541 /DNA_END=1189 /DNA_ORIENTATION=+
MPNTFNHLNIGIRDCQGVLPVLASGTTVLPSLQGTFVGRLNGVLLSLLSGRAAGHAELDSKPAALCDRDDNEVRGRWSTLALVSEVPGLSTSRACTLAVGTVCNSSLLKSIRMVLAPLPVRSSTTNGSSHCATGEGSGSAVLRVFLLIFEGGVQLDFQFDHPRRGADPAWPPCFRTSGLRVGFRRGVANRRGAPPTPNVLRSGLLEFGIPHAYCT